MLNTVFERWATVAWTSGFGAVEYRAENAQVVRGLSESWQGTVSGDARQEDSVRSWTLGGRDAEVVTGEAGQSEEVMEQRAQ